MEAGNASINFVHEHIMFSASQLDFEHHA